MLYLSVDHFEPVGMPRPRASVIYQGGKPRAMLHTPRMIGVKGRRKLHPIHAYQAAIQNAARRAMRSRPGATAYDLLTGPLWFVADFRFSRPAAKTWKTKPMTSYPHTGKPDFDNLAKAVTDALTGIVYADDALIAASFVSKRVCNGSEHPGVRCWVLPFDHQPCDIAALLKYIKSKDFNTQDGEPYETHTESRTLRPLFPSA